MARLPKQIQVSDFDELRKMHSRIVLCHGVFDLLHPGHLAHFESAKRLSDAEILVVTVTADAFVNKGPGRPRFDEGTRARMLAALEVVDYVAVSRSPTAVAVIEALKPDVYAKGPDYREKEKDPTGGIYVEEAAVRRCGGRLLCTEDAKESSTELIAGLEPPVKSGLGGRRRAIVTGGAGFIGSHLVDRLLAEGWAVSVIDDLRSGRRSNLPENHPGLEIFERDVNAPADGIYRGAEVVFHLAAMADIVPSIDHPARYHRANVDGTLAVLEASRRAGVQKVVYAASSSCYGITERLPTAETERADPRYPYALTKWIGEQMVLHWGQVYGLSVTSLRFFNVYGPRSRTSGAYGAMFGVFLAQKQKGRPYTVVGDGTQRRDFIFVTDVADAIVRAREARPGSIYNVGASRPVSVIEVVRLLHGGDDAPIAFVPKRPGEPDCTWADTRLIERELGWRPQVSIEEGVTRMLEQIELWKDAPVWTPQSIANATQTWFEKLGGVTP